MKTLVLRERDLQTLRRTFARFPWVREVLVFGSRATGQARRASDIDVAISAPGASSAEWGELTDALQEAPIIYELDVVCTEQLAPGPFAAQIRQHGIRIYP